MPRGKPDLRYDWLLGFPELEWEEIRDWVRQRMAEDPAAAEIPDDEAEAFFCVSYLVRGADPDTRRGFATLAGVRHTAKGEKWVRMTTLGLLRRWKEEYMRERLTRSIPDYSFGGLPFPSDNPETWTDEFMRACYDDELNLVWLVHLRKRLGRTEDIPEFLNTVSQWAAGEYRLWLDITKLAMRRILAPRVGPPATAAAAAQASIDDMRQKGQQASLLRHGVRRLERDRKALRQQARRAERESAELISQARGDVAAARRTLRERPASFERERAERVKRFEQDRQILTQQIDGARQGFVQAISARRFRVLAGQRITVTDGGPNEPLCRLMVESLGGTYLPEGGEVTLSAAGGLAALEMSLRNLALRRVLITCDGLYRRKEGRFGVAVSGLQVRVGDMVIHAGTAVTSCGPRAGSLMAEYGALVMALTWLERTGLPAGAQVEIRSDCKSMLSRLRRTRNVKEKAGCMTLDDMARRALRRLAKARVSVTLRWVPREEVEAVDRLCDKAYRELRWYHRRGSDPRVPLKAFLEALRE